MNRALLQHALAVAVFLAIIAALIMFMVTPQLLGALCILAAIIFVVCALYSLAHFIAGEIIG
jgi:hypothetical protein